MGKLYIKGLIIAMGVLEWLDDQLYTLYAYHLNWVQRICKNETAH